jgi:nitrate/nitrite-specific signal transduction histidine kinase
MRLKTNELRDLQEALKENKQRDEEHIHDLSSKLKTITDRHRESTALINNEIKTKKQQIEQYTHQIEQMLNEKVQLENERSDLQRQVSFCICLYEKNTSFCVLVSCERFNNS